MIGSRAWEPSAAAVARTRSSRRSGACAPRPSSRLTGRRSRSPRPSPGERTGPPSASGACHRVALALAALGGLCGVAAGSAATLAVARLRGWSPVIPPVTVWGGLAAALGVGAVAGLYPALRAARLTPTEALRSP